MTKLCFRPDLIEFHKLTRSNATHNLQQAFNVAEQHLGLTKLLDPEGENDLLVLGYYQSKHIVCRHIQPCVTSLKCSLFL